MNILPRQMRSLGKTCEAEFNYVSANYSHCGDSFRTGSDSGFIQVFDLGRTQLRYVQFSWPQLSSFPSVKIEDQFCLLFKERGKVIHLIARFPFTSVSSHRPQPQSRKSCFLINWKSIATRFKSILLRLNLRIRITYRRNCQIRV